MSRVPKKKGIRVPIGSRDSYRGFVEKVVPIGKQLEKIPFGFCRIRLRREKGRRWIPVNVRHPSTIRQPGIKRLQGWVNRNLIKVPREVAEDGDVVALAEVVVQSKKRPFLIPSIM